MDRPRSAPARRTSSLAALALSASALLLLFALPAAARAAYDVGITQTQSATVVPKGGQVTFSAEVRNNGPETDEAVYAELGSLAGHGKGADDPYLSFSTSQGTCADKSGDAFGTTYHLIVCNLGALAPGASAKITAVVQANQSAKYSATLLPNAYEGGYQDANNANNAVTGRVTVSVPPVLAGSKKIKLGGLPKGCAPGDFTLRASSSAKGVKGMKASLFYMVDGDGHTWQKSANGNRLVATVPVSQLSNELGLSYLLKVKAKLGGGRHLTATASFELC